MTSIDRKLDSPPDSGDPATGKWWGFPRYQPLEARLFAALFVTVLMIAVPLYGVVIVQARNYAEAQLRQNLTERLNAAARHAGTPFASGRTERGGSGISARPGTPQDADLQARLWEFAYEGDSWGLLVPAGGPVYFTDGLMHPAPPAEALALARSGLPAEYRLDAEAKLVLLRATPQGVIGLAGNLGGVTAFILQLCRINLTIAAALVFFASLVGAVLLRAGLRPLRAISEQARELSAARLHQRLAVPKSRDDLRTLALSLNSMLDRLDSSFSALRAEESRTRAFAADASHELRTPLTAVSGYLEVLVRAPDDAQTRLSLLLSARREAERANRLVEDLLTLTRLDSGEALRPEPLEVREWLGRFVDRVRPLITQHTVVVEVQGLSQVWIHADPLRLEQALWNLLRNAARHAPAETTVVVRAEQALDTVHFTVEDEGPGFTPEGLTRGFERFYRAQKDSSGAGLGLAIVRSIAEAHGGLAQLGNRSLGGAFVRFSAPGHPKA
ncbi:ATP-binding protein [Deinococcus altitudinis]|uniref:sensor histidine kinase n=1 Tax=Deinococcus altitudinis TaxID=468914 RepID=UPI003891FEC2